MIHGKIKVEGLAILGETSIPVFPGHALHEKSLQRQIGVGTLVSSPEHRVLLVPRFNRGSTVGFVPPSVYVGFRLFVLPKSRSRQLSSIPSRDVCVLREQTCRARSVKPPRRAPPDPTRPWYVRVLDSTNVNSWGS